MKIGSVIICIALGIWIAYNKPEIADQLIGYINFAVDNAIALFNSVVNGTGE